MKKHLTLLATAFLSCLTIGCQSVDIKPTLKIDPQVLELSKGDISRLSLIVTPEDAVLENPVWTSSSDKIATVDNDGTVTAVSAGNAIVSLTASGIVAECIIKVLPSNVSNIELDKNYAQLKIGESIQLNANIQPDDADYGHLRWSSSDENVADVTQEGLVTALKAGETTVTVSVSGITSSCKVTVADTPEIGDYFYSDGSYSSEYNSLKEVIGIVFWTGDPTLTDPSLKEDYPDCRNGLVVGLKESDVIAWQSKYEEAPFGVAQWIKNNGAGYKYINSDDGSDDPINLIVGYDNTKALIEYNSANENSAWKVEAIQPILDYRDEVPVPDNTSIWYLPSPKELHLMCAGGNPNNIRDNFGTEIRDILNDRLGSLKGADCFSKTFYWSSMEWVNPTSIWTIHFYEGYLGANDKKGFDHRVRAVLAF